VFTGPEDHGRTVASPPGKPGWGFKPSYYQAGGVHATGGRNATESSPRPGSGPMMVLNATPSPNMTNETTDKPSNGIVPFARIMRPVLGGAMDDSQINMVLFTMREGRVKIPRLGRRESQRFTMLGLPQFNFYLAKTQKQPVAEEELMSPDDIWYGGVRRPGWSLGGVVITEEGADERTSPHNPRRGSERLLNIAIHGYTTVGSASTTTPRPMKRCPTKTSSARRGGARSFGLASSTTTARRLPCAALAPTHRAP